MWPTRQVNVKLMLPTTTTTLTNAEQSAMRRRTWSLFLICRAPIIADSKCQQRIYDSADWLTSLLTDWLVAGWLTNWRTKWASIRKRTQNTEKVLKSQVFVHNARNFSITFFLSSCFSSSPFCTVLCDHFVVWSYFLMCIFLFWTSETFWDTSNTFNVRMMTCPISWQRLVFVTFSRRAGAQLETFFAVPPKEKRVHHALLTCIWSTGIPYSWLFYSQLPVGRWNSAEGNYSLF